tara:strand:+ start:771 stop:1433 length:663 start_codon:yes stop_codon:yes gene_type:complete
MHKSIKNLLKINNNVKLKLKKINFIKHPKIIAVSKTFKLDHIKPLIDHGHVDFGENKVQEAKEKWTNVKSSFKNLQLHMIGKLQKNKVKDVVPLFDYIHSLDSLGLAEKISNEQKKTGKSLKIFIQVNIGDEQQKSGIKKENLKDFYEKCVNDLKLNIIGLMCIPPLNSESKFYFNEMTKLNNSIGLTDLSMGMSSDYLDAIDCGATFIRIGSNIFGKRS